MRSVIAKQGPEALFKQLAGPYLQLYQEPHTTAAMTVDSSKDDDVLTLVNYFVVPGFFFAFRRNCADGAARCLACTDYASGSPAAESRHTPLGFQFPGIVRHNRHS